MTSRRILPLLVASSLLLTAPALRAAPLSFAEPMLEPGPFLLWDPTFTLRAGGGHKDNPTYAPTFREPAGFMSLGVDLLLLRLPAEGNSFHLYFTGDDRRYFGAPSVRKEQNFVTQAQFKHEWTDWTGTLTGQQFYADQVFDLSDQSGGGVPTLSHVQATGHTLSLRPELRRALGGGWWAEGGLGTSRQYFGDPLDGYWEHSPRFTLGRAFGHKSTVELALAGALRRYDDSALIGADGTVLAGTSQELTTRAVDLAWRHRWDKEQHWRTLLRAVATRVADNGESYFDYDKLAALAQVQFESGRWLAKLTGRFTRYTYAVQRAGGPGSEPRERDELSAEARVEYQLRPKLKLVAAFELERALANVRFDNYRSRQVSAGLEWEL